MSQSHLCVSIVLYQTPIKQIKRCLESLVVSLAESFLASLHRDGTLILIDNSEVPLICNELRGWIQCEFQKVGFEFKLIEGHGNIGYGSAQNKAIEKRSMSDDAYHIFMNPDVELEEKAIFSGLKYLSLHREVCMVSPSSLSFSGDRQFLCKTYPTVFDLLLRAIPWARFKQKFDVRMARYEMREISNNSLAKEVAFASGCFMLCRHDAISRIRGFDEKFFMYFEDFDLSLRLTKVGKLMYLPSMKIRHAGGNASRKGFQHVAMFIRSAARFFNKHGWRWY